MTNELTNEQLHTKLARLGACHEAVEWVGKRSPVRAWRECERPDWLLWIAARTGEEKNEIALAACDCAEWALRFVPEGEDRPAKAIEAARLYIAGKLTLRELLEAARAAEAAWAVWAAEAAWAVWAAAWAAEAAWAVWAAAEAEAAWAVWAAEAAAEAATRAAEAVEVAGADQQEARITLCGLVRSRLKMPRLVVQEVKKT